MARASSWWDAIWRRHPAIGGLLQLAKLSCGDSGGRGSIFISVFSAGIIWFCAWHMASEDASRTEAAAYRDTANLARGFEENIIRLIQAYDQILLFARSSYIKHPEGFDLIQWARDQNFVVDAAFQIVIINKDGFLAASTLGVPDVPMDLNDREHFRTHVLSNRDELFISKPVLGRVSGKWSIQLSRRIFAADASFAGVVLVSIDPDYLAGFYDSIELNNMAMILLAGLDGIVRVRVSGYDRSIGQSIASGALFQHLAQDNTGSFVTDGKLEGIPRLSSYRRVKGYPLVVAVGLARSEVFASVKYHRILYYGASVFVSVLILIFTAMILKRQIGLQRARDKSWQAANLDHLTKLPNRNKLYDDVNLILCGSQSLCEPFALLLLDLDNFKVVNDTLGHEAGDLVLCTTAERIRTMLRGADLVARLGGDEFAVLVRGGLSRPEIDGVGQRILSEMRKTIDYRGQSIEMGVSLGIAFFPDHAATWSNILRSADLALYRAKRDGRNRVVVFEPEMLVETEQKFKVLASVRSAIEGNRIVPFYQPEIVVANGKVAGFEALARIVDSDGSITMPAEFISALEDPEAGRMFGQKMMEAVFRDLQTWLDAGLDVKRVAVNVSNVELRAEDYANRVMAMLRSHRISPGRFEIEITESSALDEKIPAIARNLNALAAQGVSIALDDFGTGYASLTHIKSLPITRVKIDRSFITNITTDTESDSIVDAIVHLSHNLGKSVVAEGVEDHAQLIRLRSLQCDIAQGFLFSKPMPFDEVGAYLLRHIAEAYLSPERIRTGPARLRRQQASGGSFKHREST
jgi:diguanylate cyclase (GGDEF)-like protein